MEEKSLSISVRLRRSTIETARVTVPITEEVTRPGEDGSARKLDVDKIIDAALRIGKLTSTNWELEGDPEISLHPVQADPEQSSVQ
jgi:hypothetical protein